MFKKMADKLSAEQLLNLKTTVFDLQNRLVDVDEWKKVADELTDQLKHLYDTIGRPNDFHHPIKDISPDCYGKASTFRKQLKIVQGICNAIFLQMLNTGKIKDDNNGI